MNGKRVSRAYNIRGYSSIKDNESDSYVPSTDISMANDAGNYYACEVTYTFKGKTYKHGQLQALLIQIQRKIKPMM